tara:strand:+ start:96 stop:644 length:549 start_codon:yes stop_codon:yes gene_type:complete
MKLTKKLLKKMIKEELQNLDEGLKRFKVYVSGESEPLVLLGKNEKDVKHIAHQMIQNSSVKIRKVVKEGKKKSLKVEDFGMSSKQLPSFSSKEAKKVIDDSLRDWAKDLRKTQYRIIKDWMSKAKSGVIDYFDIVRGIQVGDASRAHPNETEFLHSLLNKDKIMNRFRSYFGGKKGKNRGKK